MTGRSMILAPTGRDRGERAGGEKWETEKDEDKNLQTVREQKKWSSAMLLFGIVRCIIVSGNDNYFQSQPAELIGFHF